MSNPQQHSHPPSFDQAFHLLSLARDKNLTLEQLQLLYGLGFVSDLFEAAKIGLDLNRDNFRRALRLDPLVFVVTMGVGETTDYIVAEWRSAGHYASNLINQSRFPIRALENPYKDEIVLVDPGKKFNEEEGLAILGARALLPPTEEHWLRFAREHGQKTRGVKPFIVFLYEQRRPEQGNLGFGCISRSPDNRALFLDYSNGEFDHGCVLAGVRPRKQHSAA